MIKRLSTALTSIDPFAPLSTSERKTMNATRLRLTVILFGVIALASMISGSAETAFVATAPIAPTVAMAQIENVNGGNDFSEMFSNPLSANEMAKVNGLAGSVKISEWLGPLAPIAISPFFGITLLAGISQFGSETLPFNEFISNNPILSNPATFWVFLTLTVLTSLPRFTKVSKPAAQAIDQLETYAAIITIVLLRVLASSGETAEVEPVVFQAGFFSMSADVLMSIAAIINIVVINTIKFFFEVSVWLIPFPMVDAALEVANKSVCVALMGVYAYSPMWATLINLLVFGVCLVAFRWVQRRTTYLRALLLDPIWTMLSPRFAQPQDHLIVFPQQSLGPFKAKSKLVMKPSSDGWSLTQHRFLLPAVTMDLPRDEHQPAMTKGLIANRIELASGNRLLFSRRHSNHLKKLAENINVKFDGQLTELKPSVSPV